MFIYLIYYNHIYIQTNIYVKQMNGSKTNRTSTSKPVNINISFTINPKNIVNQHSFGLQNQLKNKKISGTLQLQNNDKQASLSKPKTPDLSNTERMDLNKEFLIKVQDKKYKKSRKRNSVDQTYLNDFNKKLQADKSVNLYKEAESLHIRKSSTKSKKQQQSSIKRKHNKTVSKMSVIEGLTMKQSISGITGPTIDQKNKNFKNIINKLITNQLSKRSLPISLPTQQNKTARKKKVNRKKELKQGHSEYLIRKNEKQQPTNLQAINRKMLIQKLTSLRSMNNSIFKSEQDQQIKPRQRRTIVINTDQSIDCIDQIHQIQKASSSIKRTNFKQNINDKQKANQTKSLIQHYIALMNQQIQQQGRQEQQPIQQEFQKFREQFKKRQQVNYYNNTSRSRNNNYQTFQIQQQKILDNKEVIKIVEQKEKQRVKQKEGYSQKQRQRNMLRQFCSSQMTKQQKMINQIQRVKLNQLKKHQVQKWGQLLSFIKKSLNQGKTNHDEILNDIYHFLEQTKIDLQKQISKQSQKSREKDKQKDLLQDFTNKFSSNQLPLSAKKQNQLINKYNYSGQKQFNQISSMSYKDEDYSQQNQQLKLMNLQMIQNALKSRHQNLLQKKNKQICNLQQQKNNGKITQSQFLIQKQRLQKWTKKQTGQIMQARKNIWKGYNQAKGIIQKSLKSKHFQQQSAKKKSMMKCLSQDYLLKSYNYKKLLKPQQYEEEESQDEKEQKKSNIHYPSQSQQHNQEDVQKHISNQPSLEDPSEDQEEYQQFQIKNKNISKGNIKKWQNYQQHEQSVGESNEQQKQSVDEYVQHRVLNHDKQMRQLKQLGQQDDMNILKQKLQDIKNKRFHEDERKSVQNSDQQQQHVEQISKSNQQISYQQVDNELHESISDTQIKLINQELGKQIPSPALRKSSQQLQRLRHILPEDKEDIFEFIFLDLSIQLYQEPCHDNRIMDAINNYVSYMKRQATKKKGVKTNLNVVKQYLKRFLGFILRAHKNVLKTLDQPVGPTALQMLRYMHQNEEDGAQCEQPPSPLVIPTSVFDLFQKSFLPSIQFETFYENDEEKENKRIQFLKNILHIHNKALFDGMNEYLDLLRPFGIWGKPFPWKNSSTFQHTITQQQKQAKLKKASQKVIEYCSYVCGLLVDKQQSLVGNARLTQDYIQQIKQDRLSRMLATQLMENQQRWLFYDDEQTEVLVQISTAVYTIILKQATHEVSQIIKNRRSL